MTERDVREGATNKIAPVAPGRCPAIGDVGAVQPEMDRGNVARSFSIDFPMGVSALDWEHLKAGGSIDIRGRRV